VWFVYAVGLSPDSGVGGNAAVGRESASPRGMLRLAWTPKSQGACVDPKILNPEPETLKTLNQAQGFSLLAAEKRLCLPTKEANPKL